ncbi:MAG: ribonuclease III [Desulfobacterales bacterium]
MDIATLEKNLGHDFKNKKLIQAALCHRSYINEQSDTALGDNERLEFLGDAVLNLTAGHILMDFFPDLKEGDLSRMRAGLVNESRLASIAKTIDLGEYLKLGKGELQTNGREKKSILADAFEAVIAAVYLDGGFDASFRIIKLHFSSFLNSISKPTANLDYKSRLQELVQTREGSVPSYHIIDETGPDHDKTFRAQLKIQNIITEGTGKSKKLAEQVAAKNALEILEKNQN